MSPKPTAIYQYIGKSSELYFDDIQAPKSKYCYYKVQSYKFASGYNDSGESAIDTGWY